MKAIGRNLIIQKVKEGTTKTKGGLLLAESHRDDIRYIEANGERPNLGPNVLSMVF